MVAHTLVFFTPLIVFPHSFKGCAPNSLFLCSLHTFCEASLFVIQEDKASKLVLLAVQGRMQLVKIFS